MGKSRRNLRLLNRLAFSATLISLTILVTNCVSSTSPPDSTLIHAVGAESQYANVIAQIGGRRVDAVAILSNPNVDPHSFQASPSIARTISQAQLVVRNGLGLDDWATKMLAASPSSSRKVISVQTLLNLPDSTPNPHLWYDPTTMPTVANAIAADLSALQPANAGYFQTNLATFIASLGPWNAEIAKFKAAYSGVPVAVSSPLANYLLEAAGCDIRTPFTLQVSTMRGSDPSPQDVALQNNLLKTRAVKVLVYNQQVTNSLTESFRSLAEQYSVPILGAYETLPDGYNYQSWMLAETVALEKAVTENVSTEKL